MSETDAIQAAIEQLNRAELGPSGVLHTTLAYLVETLGDTEVYLSPIIKDDAVILCVNRKLYVSASYINRIRDDQESAIQENVKIIVINFKQ